MSLGNLYCCDRCHAFKLRRTNTSSKSGRSRFDGTYSSRCMDFYFDWFDMFNWILLCRMVIGEECFWSHQASAQVSNSALCKSCNWCIVDKCIKASCCNIRFLILHHFGVIYWHIICYFIGCYFASYRG